MHSGLLQRQFEENRNAELVEMQRLEEQERRRREEKVKHRVFNDFANTGETIVC